MPLFPELLGNPGNGWCKLYDITGSNCLEAVCSKAVGSLAEGSLKPAADKGHEVLDVMK